MSIKLFRILASIAVVAAMADAGARGLSIEDRVAAQRAIEGVYWNHRLWPKENPQPKPPLEAVMPEAAIRAKVEDYLRKSNALETLWGRAITAQQLQAEVDRMARDSQQPGVLLELFGALHHDPSLVAECLARPILVERLIRNWYARDQRLHWEFRRQIEATINRCRDAECMGSIGGQYAETTWRRNDATVSGAAERSAVLLTAREWTDLVSRLEAEFGVQDGPRAGRVGPASNISHAGGNPTRIPLGVVSPPREHNDSLFIRALLEQDEGYLRVATVWWPKQSFEVWWESRSPELTADTVEPAGMYELPRLQGGGCSHDTWAPTRMEVPDPRYWHTAVWTGSEMIVWGGVNAAYAVNTGGRYNPSTDAWQLTSTGLNVPAGRFQHTAVWTGTEMIVWGGTTGGFNYPAVNTGGRYNPSTDTWEQTSTGANVPAARRSHTAVWTGTEMIVWAGDGGWNTGGQYNPSTDTWAPTNTENAPAPRLGHTAVWATTVETSSPCSGAKMIVWGGITGPCGSNTGGCYDPINDTWAPTGVGMNVPGARVWHTAVWAPSVGKMIVWGGDACGGGPFFDTGGRYDPSTDTWEPTSTGTNVPTARHLHTAVWTGTEMIVWGGAGSYEVSTGGRYDPSSDTWAPTGSGNAPSARQYHTAVWTGSEMIVWGGSWPWGVNTGGRYDPSTDTWLPTPAGATVPRARIEHTAVWTGSEMIVWGGRENNGGGMSLNTGGRYYPSTDSWQPTSMGANVPSPRFHHTSVWSGTEMIVWGKENGENTGGRYNPSSDTWRQTNTADAPVLGANHSAVWTGTEMIVWGGTGTMPNSPSNLGGRYDPQMDTWALTNSTDAPTGRHLHTAVWTGGKMIVWGGEGASGVSLNSGGRYDPWTDTWAPTGSGNAPSARQYRTAVWTGSEMIVWGGAESFSTTTDTGGSYNAATDSWFPTNVEQAPQERAWHTAVSTGNEMIVWGGAGSVSATTGARPIFDTGAWYDPALETWTPTSTENAPIPRIYHTAVWTGAEMIMWGGWPPTSSGGRYCYSPICNLSPPTGLPLLELSVPAPGIAHIGWRGVTEAAGYDLVRGSLNSLRATGGDFSTATGDCLKNNLPATFVDDPITPDESDAFWYLVRAVNCAGAGSYDSGGSSQIAPRDSEILASGPACP